MKLYSIYWRSPVIATNMSMGTVKRLRYILKDLLDFKNNLINIGCATLYHLSMMLRRI